MTDLRQDRMRRATAPAPRAPGTQPLPASDALEVAIDRLIRAQSPDGLWRAPSEPGATHSSLALIARSLLVEKDEPSLREDIPFVAKLLDVQTADGSFPPFAGARGSLQVTRLVRLALGLFRDRMEPLPHPPALQARVIEAEQRAQAFIIRAPPPSEPVFLEVLADVLTDAISPAFPRALWGVPGAARAARWMLGGWGAGPVRDHLSLFAVRGMPALAVLYERSARKAPWRQRLNRLLGTRHSDEALVALEQDICSLQGESGGWLWNVLGTGLNLIALWSLGRDTRDPAVQKGLAFINSMRMLTERDGPVQSCCNSEIWDSCAAAAVLLSAGVLPERFKAAALVETVLAEQKRDGVWSFGAGGAEGDLDSSTAVVSLLADLGPHLNRALGARVGTALERGLDALLAGQQDDGGWGYSPSPHQPPYAFGRRIPGALESGLVDASTPDVTGRVVTALQAIRDGIPLEPERHELLSRAIQRSLEYFERTQTPFGAWWSRWSAGYLSGAMFVLGALAKSTDPGVGIQARARTFVLESQNPDGGWGETVEADLNPGLAGLGRSTPLQTAYALLALRAGPKGWEVEPAVQRGLGYLLATQENGTWRNGIALFTHAFQEDYYEAPLLTHCLIIDALAKGMGPRGV